MIKTGSVLEKLQANVDKHRKRVARAEARIDALREQYKVAHWSKRREIENKGWRASQALGKARVECDAAELALKTEETRLLQPDASLRFG